MSIATIVYHGPPFGTPQGGSLIQHIRGEMISDVTASKAKKQLYEKIFPFRIASARVDSVGTHRIQGR
jgi:hypothetical protein